MGYRVTAYTDSQEALDWFQTDPHAVDLVITDQTMPELSGEALARELHRLRPQLPIILCTGFSHTMTEEHRQGIGIRAVLLKPVARRHLCMTVQSLLAETAPFAT
jgi:CheY-like chemotaxis protein